MTKGQFRHYLAYVKDNYPAKAELDLYVDLENLSCKAVSGSSEPSVELAFFWDLQRGVPAIVHYPTQFIAHSDAAIQNFESEAARDYTEEMGMEILLED